jgi:hypothetical protein
MHNNHQSTGKLEKVAESFTRLAEAYVRHVHGDLNSDPTALLNFFSISNYENYSAPTATSDQTSGPYTPFEQSRNQYPANQNISDASAWQKTEVFQQLENIAHNGGFDGTFDWFSWDQYDDSMN